MGRYLTTDECKTIGGYAHAVYGGKVYSFVDTRGMLVVHGSGAYATAVRALDTPTPSGYAVIIMGIGVGPNLVVGPFAGVDRAVDFQNTLPPKTQSIVCPMDVRS